MSTLPPPAYPGRGPVAYRPPTTAPSQPYAQQPPPHASWQAAAPQPPAQAGYTHPQPQYQPSSSHVQPPAQHYPSPLQPQIQQQVPQQQVPQQQVPQQQVPQQPRMPPQPQIPPQHQRPVAAPVQALLPPQPPTPAQSPWIEQMDQRSGKMYYYNPTTRQTQWERPAGFPGTSPPVPSVPPAAQYRPAAAPVASPAPAPYTSSAPSPAAFGHLQMQGQHYPGHNPHAQQNSLYPSMNPQQSQGTAYPNLVPMGLSQPVASAPTAAVSGNAISAIPMSYVPSNAPKAGRVAITNPQQLVAQLCKMGFTHDEATQASAIESTVDQAAEWILAYRVSQVGFDDVGGGSGGGGGGGGAAASSDTSEELTSLIERLTTFYALVPKGGAVTGLDDDKIAHIAAYYKGREDKLNKRLQEKYGFDLYNMDFADTSNLESHMESQGPPLPCLSSVTVFVRSAALNEKGKHVYTIAVLGPDNQPTSVTKRYSEFDALRVAVRTDCKECQAKLDLLPFPKKTMSVMGGAVSAAVAEKRREELEAWVQGVFALEALCSVSIPDNYHPGMILPPQPGVPAGAAQAVAKIHIFLGLLQAHNAPEAAAAAAAAEGAAGGETAAGAPPTDASWGSWLSGGAKKGAADPAAEGGAAAATATAKAAALVPVQCKLSAQSLQVEAAAGSLGLVLEERDGPTGEVCPRVFLSELKPVDGRANKLQGLVPEGASLTSIDGHDVTTCSLQRTTDYFVTATDRPRQLGFQIVHYQPLGVSSPYSTAPACNGGNVGGGSVTKCLEFSVVAQAGELGLVFNERKDANSTSPGLPKVFVSSLKSDTLRAKIPIGAALVSVCGEDVTAAGLSEVGEVLGSMRHCERELVLRVYI